MVFVEIGLELVGLVRLAMVLTHTTAAVPRVLPQEAIKTLPIFKGATAAVNMVKTAVLVAALAVAGLALVAVPLSEALIGEALREGAQKIIPWIAFAGLLNGLIGHLVVEIEQGGYSCRGSRAYMGDVVNFMLMQTNTFN